MNNVLSALTASFDAFNASYAKRYTDYIEENYKGVTVDVDGRLHAPYDGYERNGKYYRKGEFVEMNLDDSDLPIKGRFKGKVKINHDLFEGIKDLITNNGYGECSCGKTWDQDGQNVCYLYFDVFFKSVISIIKKEASFNAVKEEPVFLDEGKLTVTAKLVKVETNVFHNKYNTSVREVATFVTDNGAILKGTLPKALEDVEMGTMVEFTATFERSKFCNVYKRPSKVKII